MLKKMLVVAALLAMAGTAFGGWNFQFEKNGAAPVPPKTIMVHDDAFPDDPTKMKEVPNPDYIAFDAANIGSDRTVDWEYDSDNPYIFQRKGEVWNWPASYDYIKIGEVNVRMEIGFWIKLDCQGGKNLTLKQRTINTYGGQTKCTSQTNVATDWKVDFTRNSTGEKLFNSDKVATTITPNTNVPAGTTEHTIKVKVWDLKIWNGTPSNSCVNVGVVNIKVRPAVRPNIYMEGCDGAKYPVYSPPPATADVVWW